MFSGVHEWYLDVKMALGYDCCLGIMAKGMGSDSGKLFLEQACGRGAYLEGHCCHHGDHTGYVRGYKSRTTIKFRLNLLPNSEGNGTLAWGDGMVIASNLLGHLEKHHGGFLPSSSLF